MQRLRRTFASGRTRPLEWRLCQLGRLKAMLGEREGELLAALGADLGKSKVEAWASEAAPAPRGVADPLADVARLEPDGTLWPPVAKAPHGSQRRAPCGQPAGAEVAFFVETTPSAAAVAGPGISCRQSPDKHAAKVDLGMTGSCGTSHPPGTPGARYAPATAGYLRLPGTRPVAGTRRPLSGDLTRPPPLASGGSVYLSRGGSIPVSAIDQADIP
jgi:hypothetical protein